MNFWFFFRKGSQFEGLPLIKCIIILDETMIIINICREKVLPEGHPPLTEEYSLTIYRLKLSHLLLNK